MLGRGVALALTARGDGVTVLQRRPANLGLPEVLTDVADEDAVRAAVAGHDAVVHLAAKVNVVGPEAEYLRVNVRGTRAVVDACLAAGVERLVHVSSPSVAHPGRSLVGRGADPADPTAARGPYARSKALAERVALGADSPELGVVAIRPHLVWGPGDTQLIARVVDRARRGRLPLVGVGPQGTQQPVAVVVPAASARRGLADDELARAVRAAAEIPLAAVLTVRSLPVDIRHASKIDRTRLARWAGGVLVGARMGRP